MREELKAIVSAVGTGKGGSKAEDTDMCCCYY